jgi:hypothetical protein
VADGVLDLAGGDEPSIVRERDAAYQTERDPGLGGINERFNDLSAAHGPLNSAILYRVEGGETTLASFDNVRTPLGFEVGPGGEVTIPLQIARPAEPGGYMAEVDLVHEGMRWFSERGLGVVLIAFTVTPG